MARSIGIRKLRDELSAVLRDVRDGETIAVTDRGRPVALIVPAGEMMLQERFDALVDAGVLAWRGAKPRGSPKPPRVRGPTVAAAVLEDRR